MVKDQARLRQSSSYISTTVRTACHEHSESALQNLEPFMDSKMAEAQAIDRTDTVLSLALCMTTGFYILFFFRFRTNR